MPTSRRLVDTEGEDFYPTPAWATKVLLAHETFEGDIWEPACGNGAMSEVLKTTGNDVISTDLYNRGYGTSDCNFLSLVYPETISNIITNPPYNLAEEFVHTGLRLASRKLALLLRLSFLESAKRFESIFSRSPPSRIWVFSERITFYPNGIQTGGTGTLAYAWFVWDKQEDPAEGTRLKWFPPGYKSDSGPVDLSEAIDL